MIKSSQLLLPARWFYKLFGVESLYATGRDAWLVIFARTCRMFAFGAASLVMALFFAELGYSDVQIGLFMTLTLAGDVLLSISLTFLADSIGRRKILFLGGFLMTFSGIVFSIFDQFWILVFAAIVGVISATGGDFGPFRSVEESTLSQLTTPETRNDVLTWYVAMSSLGSAVGTEATGRIVDLLKGLNGWTIKDAYHAVFWSYILMGTMTMIMSYSMSEACESGAKKQQDLETTQKSKSRLATISSETRTIMYKLWFLLTVDSLADGMVSYTLTNYYLDRKFHLSKSTLGDIMSISYFLMTASTLFAGPLARYLGLIKTMVFTHLPSSAAVLVFPAPQTVVPTIILLFIRTGLNNMDQAPRAAFIAAVVKPEERTAAMGVTSTLRTLASTIGPTFTGFLANSNYFWIAYVVAGSLRVAYDLGLFALFVNLKLHQHEPDYEPVEQDGIVDEESVPLADLTRSSTPSVESLSSTSSKPTIEK